MYAPVGIPVPVTNIFFSNKVVSATVTTALVLTVALLIVVE